MGFRDCVLMSSQVLSCRIGRTSTKSISAAHWSLSPRGISFLLVVWGSSPDTHIMVPITVLVSLSAQPRHWTQQRLAQVWRKAGRLRWASSKDGLPPLQPRHRWSWAGGPRQSVEPRKGSTRWLSCRLLTLLREERLEVKSGYPPKAWWKITWIFHDLSNFHIGLFMVFFSSKMPRGILKRKEKLRYSSKSPEQDHNLVSTIVGLVWKSDCTIY